MQPWCYQVILFPKLELSFNWSYFKYPPCPLPFKSLIFLISFSIDIGLHRKTSLSSTNLLNLPDTIPGLFSFFFIGVLGNYIPFPVSQNSQPHLLLHFLHLTLRYNQCSPSGNLCHVLWFSPPFSFMWWTSIHLWSPRCGFQCKSSSLRLILLSCASTELMRLNYDR